MDRFARTVMAILLALLAPTFAGCGDLGDSDESTAREAAGAGNPDSEVGLWVERLSVAFDQVGQWDTMPGWLVWTLCKISNWTDGATVNYDPVWVPNITLSPGSGSLDCNNLVAARPPNIYAILTLAGRKGRTPTPHGACELMGSRKACVSLRGQEIDTYFRPEIYNSRPVLTSTLRELAAQPINVEVWDDDFLRRDDRVGSCTFQLSEADLLHSTATVKCQGDLAGDGRPRISELRLDIVPASWYR